MIHGKGGFRVLSQLWASSGFTFVQQLLVLVLTYLETFSSSSKAGACFDNLAVRAIIRELVLIEVGAAETLVSPSS